MDCNTDISDPPRSDRFDRSIQVGATWPSYDAIIEALRAEALRDNWLLWVYVRNKSQGTLILRCRKTPTCNFHLRARLESDEDGERLVVRTLRDSHTCIGAASNSRSPVNSMEFLKDQVPRLLAVTEETSTKDIQDVILRHFGHKLPLKQAQRVKKCLTSEELVQGPQQQSQQQSQDVSFEYPDLPEVSSPFRGTWTANGPMDHLDDDVQPPSPRPAQASNQYEAKSTNRKRLHPREPRAQGRADTRVIQKVAPKCSKCGQTSHNRKTCGLSAEERRWDHHKRMQARRDRIAAALTQQSHVNGEEPGADDDESDYS